MASITEVKQKHEGPKKPHVWISTKACVPKQESGKGMGMQVVADPPEFTHGETTQKVRKATEVDFIVCVSGRKKREGRHIQGMLHRKGETCHKTLQMGED